MPSVNNNGISIYYEVEGQGPPLVLQHSFSQNLESWYQNGYVEALQKDYRLILIDSRGHGASEKLHDPEAYGLEARAMDVVAVLDALNIAQAHYFGYSLGGWIGFGLARYAPARVRSLILGGSSPYGQSMALYREMLKGGLEHTLRLLEQAAGIQIPEEQRRRFYKNDVLVLQAAYSLDRPDISEILPIITMPCLLFAGEADPLYPAIRRCAEVLPRADFLSLPGLNHVQAALQIRLMLPHLTKFLAEVDQGAGTPVISLSDFSPIRFSDLIGK